jgi:hypothetical protein
LSLHNRLLAEKPEERDKEQKRIFKEIEKITGRKTIS